MKENIVNTLISRYESEIQQHRLNIDIMIANPRAIPEHESFTAAIDSELELMTAAKDKLETLVKYFQ